MKKMFILLFVALTTQTLPAQNIKQEDLIGTWEVVSIDGDIPKDTYLLNFAKNGLFKNSVTSAYFNTTTLTQQGGWKLDVNARIITLLPTSTDTDSIQLYILELNKEKLSLTVYGKDTEANRVVTFNKTNKKITPSPERNPEPKEKFKEEPIIPSEVIYDMVKSIPSPFELYFLLKDLGVKYEKSTLNYADTVGRQDADFRDALVLGTYETAFGQASIYEKTPDVLAHLETIQELVDRLQVGKEIDAEKIKRVAKMSNLDSLLTVASGYFDVLNDFFLGKRREEIVFLILTGSWIETSYMLCETYQKQPSEILKNRVGEQKLILEQLILLLSFSAKEPFIQNLMTDLEKLVKLYEDVKITYHNSQSSSVGSEITFDEKTFQAIRQSISEIRSRWIH